MDLHEANQRAGAPQGGPIGSPHEVNNLKQKLDDTQKKVETFKKQVEEKTLLSNVLEAKLKVCSPFWSNQLHNKPSQQFVP